ncbi:early nodulin-like protein 8 [Silene latifolia]|uniref:early nodulin-like protein 8 n=1 Tax=Silene latifolia TaxID=37657 RepID=UPI003D77921C
MAGNKNVTTSPMLLLLVLSCVIGICSAKSYVVGGSTGWTIPTTPSFYSNWASNQKLLVGDILVFTFPAQAHTVAEVSKSNYDACTSAATLGPVMTTAPANITLTKPGTHYFICTITGHCGANQKLTVTVAASTPAPVATPTPSPKSSPTPSPKTSPAPSPMISPTPSPSPTTSPSPSPSTPAPTVAPTPAASGPGAKSPSTVPSAADSPGDSGSATPPAGNSAAAAATGVTLFSLLSIVSFALVF